MFLGCLCMFLIWNERRERKTEKKSERTKNWRCEKTIQRCRKSEEDREEHVIFANEIREKGEKSELGIRTNSANVSSRLQHLWSVHMDELVRLSETRYLKSLRWRTLRQWQWPEGPYESLYTNFQIPKESEKTHSSPIAMTEKAIWMLSLYMNFATASTRRHNSQSSPVAWS